MYIYNNYVILHVNSCSATLNNSTICYVVCACDIYIANANVLASHFVFDRFSWKLLLLYNHAPSGFGISL